MREGVAELVVAAAFGDAVERSFAFAKDRTFARAILTAVAIFTAFAGLATVGLHTAAAASDAQIPGLAGPEAARLRDRLAALGETREEGL